MGGLKRGARNKTYGIGALALVAMPGILGTPYPAPVALANHSRISVSPAGAAESPSTPPPVRASDGTIEDEL
jgi:hypothetical protein